MKVLYTLCHGRGLGCPLSLHMTNFAHLRGQKTLSEPYGLRQYVPSSLSIVLVESALEDPTVNYMKSFHFSGKCLFSSYFLCPFECFPCFLSLLLTTIFKSLAVMMLFSSFPVFAGYRKPHMLASLSETQDSSNSIHSSYWLALQAAVLVAGFQSTQSG